MAKLKQKPLLTQDQLDEINLEMSAKADAWLTRNLKQPKSSEQDTKPKSNRGAKPRIMLNPFYTYVGTTTGWSRYPAFAMDIIEGVARLDWYDQRHRNIPLSVYKLCVILESLPVITKEAIQDLFHYKDKQAQRYYNAIELIVPRMMDARPTKLIELMSDIEVSPLKESEWDDIDDVCKPTPEELAKLHHDLRTFTEYGTEACYNAYWGFDKNEQYARRNYTIEDAQKHSQELRVNPKKGAVLSLLNGGLNVSEVQRQTGVSRPTITKWRDEEKAA